MNPSRFRKRFIYLGLIVATAGLQGCAIAEGIGDALVETCEQPELNPTKFEDTNDGICTASDCSLREAIITANACAGEDIINLSPGTYNLDLAGSSTYPSEFRFLEITEDVILNGNTAVIDGEDLVITGTTTNVSISNVSLHALRNEGDINAVDLTTRRILNTGDFEGTNVDVLDGSGIRNEGAFSIIGGNVLRNSGRGGIGDNINIVLNLLGDMVLNDVLIADNTASAEYEGEFPEMRAVTNDNGDIVLNDVVIRDNNPPGIGRGAGIWNSGGSFRSSATLNRVTISGHEKFSVVNSFADLEIVDSTIQDNNGGALFNGFESEVRIVRSLVSGNGNRSTLSSACGAILNLGFMTFENSTISESIDSGAGCASIENWAHLELISSTVFGNSLPAILDQDTGTPETRIERSILANNLGGNCLSSVATSSGNNLFDDISCSHDSAAGDIVDTSGMLGIQPLADNGGPTFTHGLVSPSPAVDAAGESCLLTDQRGTSRPLDGDGDGLSACDIGAFELDPDGSGTTTAPGASEMTPEPSPTVEPSIPTPPDPITINFNADSYSIEVGECTRLRWDVENADLVTLEGEDVPPLEAEQVCPPAITTYRMVASNAAEKVERSVTIEVTIPVVPPDAPAQLHIADQVCTGQSYSVTLGWIDVADNEDGYRVYRDGALIGTLVPNAKGFTDNPAYGGPYTYGVEAFNSAGASTRPTAQDAGCII